MAQSKSKQQLAHYLRGKRIEVGLSQDDVANTLGYSSAQFVSNWERGVSPPPLKNLHKIVKIYNIDSEEVIQLLLRAEEENLRRLLKGKARGR